MRKLYGRDGEFTYHFSCLWAFDLSFVYIPFDDGGEENKVSALQVIVEEEKHNFIEHGIRLTEVVEGVMSNRNKQKNQEKQRNRQNKIKFRIG